MPLLLEPSRPAGPAGRRTAVFTIGSKNYLPYARTLHQSLRQVHPDWDAWLLLADRVEGCFDPTGEPFRVLALDELPIPERAKFCFRYSILELNTAAKPWGFRWLFERGYERVVYLDPDIFVYAPLAAVTAAWDSGALAVLTPHLTRRLPSDGHKPGERDILIAGAYNLGFLALGQHRELAGLLAYWCEKSLHEFVVDIEAGLFTDQKWMDLVPGMFPDVCILRHAGYNVAYWNLPCRTLQVDGEGDGIWVRVDAAEPQAPSSERSEPLIFFHFSGLNPDKPDLLSKHQDRYRLSALPVVDTLVRRYGELLRRNGYDRCRKWPYAFGRLTDGTPIPDELRRLYRRSEELRQLGGEDPFTLTAATLNASKDGGRPPISWIMRAIYAARPDLQAAFPQAADNGRDRAAFREWFYAHAAADHKLDAAWVPPPQGDAGKADQGTRPKPGGHRRRYSYFQGRRWLFLTSAGVRGRFGAMDRLPGWRLFADAARKGLWAWRAGRLPLTSPRQMVRLLGSHLREHRQQRFIGGGAGTKSSAGAAAPSRAYRSCAPPGLNLVGYVNDPTGIGESARACTGACQAVGLPFVLCDARAQGVGRPRLPVNLLHVNADQIPHVFAGLGSAFFAERYSVAIWHWELDQLPDEYLASFDYLDEIWAPSLFVLRCIAEKSPIPVVHMPHSVQASASSGASRSAFGLPEDAFLFLTMYDMLSVQERKNPLGTIAAFSRAFPEPGDVRLVIKINHGSSRPDDLARLQERAAETPGILLLDCTLGRQEVYDLQAVCDAFISLHRSEGWGLNLSESMLLGKPVIATAYSGNLDFMTPQNSCLVDHRLVPLSEDFGPYRKGNRWADPDVEHAAFYMRMLVGDAAKRRELGARARHTIATEFSPQAAGLRYKRRLQQIERFR